MAAHKDTIQINSGIPPIYYSEHTLVSTGKKWLSLGVSDLQSDAGQNVVPFIDVQPVEPNPPVPLSSVSFYHKAASEDSGGFLGLEVLNYDLATHVNFNKADV